MVPIALGGMFLALLVFGVILRIRRGAPTAEDREREELRARYARGEIDPQEYARRLRRLRDGMKHDAA